MVNVVLVKVNLYVLCQVVVVIEEGCQYIGKLEEMFFCDLVVGWLVLGVEVFDFWLEGGLFVIGFCELCVVFIMDVGVVIGFVLVFFFFVQECLWFEWLIFWILEWEVGCEVGFVYVVGFVSFGIVFLSFIIVYLCWIEEVLWVVEFVLQMEVFFVVVLEVCGNLVKFGLIESWWLYLKVWEVWLLFFLLCQVGEEEVSFVQLCFFVEVVFVGFCCIGCYLVFGMIGYFVFCIIVEKSCNFVFFVFVMEWNVDDC